VTKSQSKELRLGVYRIYWKSGGSSLASVGIMYNGDRWFAPANWTSNKYPHPIVASTKWISVKKVKLIKGA